MFKLSLLVPAAAALMLAGEGIYYAVASRQQVAVSCDEFRRARPASPRVLITGCDINFAGAGYRESSGQVEELYLPARPAGNQSVAAPFVVATRIRRRSRWSGRCSAKAAARPASNRSAPCRRSLRSCD